MTPAAAHAVQANLEKTPLRLDQRHVSQWEYNNLEYSRLGFASATSYVFLASAEKY